MKVTEQILLKTSKDLSAICHLAKNLYNLANYYVRQEYFYLGTWLRYYDLDFILKKKDAYRKLPSQTSQQILRLIDKNWKSFFKAIKDWKSNPKKYKMRPKPPKYKQKDGESITIFTNQQCRIKKGFLYFPKKCHLKPIKTRIRNSLHQVRILPKGVGYKLEIVYDKEIIDFNLNKANMIGIDLGLNNLATIANNIGKRPIIVKGGIVKSINQYYNKELARLRSIKDKQKLKGDTKRIKKLHLKRNNKINVFFHRVSKYIINYCLENDIGSIIIGYNKNWKQNINIGKKNNQKFVLIPFNTFVSQLIYKSKLVGIQVKMIAESYTSKCSFLDKEPIMKHSSYKGKRISRSLFKTSKGHIINADINAAYNILKKGFPNAISADGIEVAGLQPQLIINELVDIIN